MLEPFVWVRYIRPPEEEDMKAEWLENARYLLEDLGFLLSLPHARFWSRVVQDQELHNSLESFLNQGPRDYDLSVPESDIEVEHVVMALSRRVFIVFIRMATYKESGVEQMPPEVFAQLIYDKYVFDIPKLIGLCSMYGPKNHALLTKMVSHIFTVQPAYTDDMLHFSASLHEVFESIKQETGLVLESGRSTGCPVWRKLKDICLFLVDTCMSLWRFVDIYPPSANVFHQYTIDIRLASLYDAVMPDLSIGVQKVIESDDADCKSREEGVKMLDRLKHARLAIINAFRQILFIPCIHPLLQSSGERKGAEATQGEASTGVEDFIVVITSCLGERTFIVDYENYFPFEDDLSLLQQASIYIDATRTDYILEGIRSCQEVVLSRTSSRPGPTKVSSYPDEPSIAASSSLIPGVQTPPHEEFLPKSNVRDEMAVTREAAASRVVTGVELDSLITKVKDLFHDFGEGFILACLEEYKFDPEEVINAVLEESLPPGLASMDHTLPRQAIPEQTAPPSALESRHCIYDGDEFDIFRRDDVDLSKIHRGKKREDFKDAKEMLNCKKDLAPLQDLYSAYGAFETEGSLYDKHLLEYEDEYDDTYDENAVGQQEPDAVELEGRTIQMPRVLAALDQNRSTRQERKAEMNGDKEEEDDENEEEQQKRDEFVPNPEELRRLREERRGNAKGKGQDKEVLANRRHKEAHKGHVGNHNRRAGAQWKRRGGMVPF
ncbi:unnamed protein product [Darwinula stevensoni]|uniref:CUE domain-containing protein n=1 Tax=Darwinula stevensoni TaxID=69355 RepID=A0A7R9A454_9CRUS|nr:unnamed protein product [Darwinula stevensoni]CAG0891869.1 unnamed protein product [Darwinula stevensoni]